MKVNLHIDRIVVDGASLTARERERLARTLERELARQLRLRLAAGAVGERAAPGEAAERGSGRRERSPLAGRIATGVMAVLPLETFTAHPPPVDPRTIT